MRVQLTREFYAPKGVAPITREGIDAVAYAYDKGTGPIATMFVGKQAKPAEHVLYRTAERRDEAIERFFEARAKAQAFKEQRKAEAKARRDAAKESVKVGDIFYASWGYDQTNVQFFQVVEKKGVTCKLQEIGATVVRTEQTCEYVEPCAEVKIGEPMTKRINNYSHFTFDVFNAYPYEGKPRYQTAWGYGH